MCRIVKDMEDLDVCSRQRDGYSRQIPQESREGRNIPALANPVLRKVLILCPSRYGQNVLWEGQIHTNLTLNLVR